MTIGDMAAESGAVLVLQMDTQERWGQGSGVRPCGTSCSSSTNKPLALEVQAPPRLPLCGMGRAGRLLGIVRLEAQDSACQVRRTLNSLVIVLLPF